MCASSEQYQHSLSYLKGPRGIVDGDCRESSYEISSKHRGTKKQIHQHSCDAAARNQQGF